MKPIRDRAEVVDRRREEGCVDPFSFNTFAPRYRNCAPLEPLDPAGQARGVFLAAAVLHPQELGAALVEFVVADRRELQAHQVHCVDGRLVEEVG